MIDLTTPQRQSPVAIVFLGLRILRSLGLAQIALAVFVILRSPLGGPVILVPFALIILFGAVSALAWWRYTFQVVGTELIVDKGVIRADRLTVSADRIQSLAIDQELLHRLTGLVKVSIDTAGSDEAEFTIDAVSRPVAEELQRQVVTAAPSKAAGTVGEHVGGAAPITQEQVVFTQTPGRLFLAAVTTWPLTGLVLLAPLIALGDQLRDKVRGELPQVDTSGFRWWWVLAGVAVFLVMSVILNIAQVLLKDWQLTLRASQTSLRRTSGLLSRTSKASTVARVQVVSSNQNPLQRSVGIRGVELSTIGEGNFWLVGCDDRQFDVVRSLTGAATTEQLVLDRRIHPAQVWLRVRNTMLLTVPLTVVGVVVLGWWAVATVLAVPLVWLTQHRHVKNFRWSLGPELATRSYVLDSNTQQTKLRKTNTVSVTQTIFERRRGLGRVHLFTAAGTVSVGMIPIDEANAVRDTILHAVETDRHAWM